MGTTLRIELGTWDTRIDKLWIPRAFEQTKGENLHVEKRAQTPDSCVYIPHSPSAPNKRLGEEDASRNVPRPDGSLPTGKNEDMKSIVVSNSHYMSMSTFIAISISTVISISSSNSISNFYLHFCFHCHRSTLTSSLSSSSSLSAANALTTIPRELPILGRAALERPLPKPPPSANLRVRLFSAATLFAWAWKSTKNKTRRSSETNAKRTVHLSYRVLCHKYEAQLVISWQNWSFYGHTNVP